MNGSTDPIVIANVLLEKTNTILDRLERDEGNDGPVVVEEVYKDLATYREQSSRREKQSQKEVWKQDLMAKILKLERELEEMKSSQRLVKKTESDMLLDIVSSRTLSPVKNPVSMGKTFRKSSSNQLVDLKSNLMRTERIMDRGFKTARELNDKMERLKTKRPSKEVEVQVSPIHSKLSATSSDNDSYIRGLAEGVTSLLVQQDVRKAAKSRVNTRNLVIRSQDERRAEIPRGRRLVVQKLPDNYIRKPLTVRQLPSVDIAPNTEIVCSVENTKVFLIQHETGRKSKSCSLSLKSSPKKRLEVGVQAELSERSKNASLEKLIKTLGQKYRETNGSSNLKKIEELSKDIQESKLKCELLSQRHSNPIAVKSSSCADNQSPRNSQTEEEYKSDFEVESLVQDSQSKSSIEAASLSAKPDGKSKTTSLSEDESLIEMQMKRLGLSTDRVPVIKKLRKSSKLTESSSENSSLLYVKQNGKYVPVNHVDSHKVQIIVPEIVVRLPEAVNSEKQVKQDQLIQTDEGFATLTSGDTSSVIEQLNKRFERTELLLEQMGGSHHDGNHFLGLLKKRRDAELGQNQMYCFPGEETNGLKKRIDSRERQHEDLFEEEFTPTENLNSSQSIGEVLYNNQR